jgi:hypothetical protein
MNPPQLPSFFHLYSSSIGSNINPLLHPPSLQAEDSSVSRSEQKQEEVLPSSFSLPSFSSNHRFALPEERPLSLEEILQRQALTLKLNLLKTIDLYIETIGKEFKAFIQIERDPVICQKFIEMQQAIQQFTFSLSSVRSLTNQGISFTPSVASSSSCLPSQPPVSQTSTSTTSPRVVSDSSLLVLRMIGMLSEQMLKLFQQGCVEEAYQQSKTILSIDPHNVLALCMVATILEQKQCSLEAGSLFRQAMKYAPDNFFIQECYVKCLKNQGLFGQAEEECKKMLKKHPQDKVVLGHYLDCVFKQNKLMEACDVCERLLMVDSADEFARKIAHNLIQKGFHVNLPVGVFSPS